MIIVSKYELHILWNQVFMVSIFIISAWVFLFSDNHNDIKVMTVIKTGSFILEVFSLGWKEDKIMNTIKIPPVNKSIRIIGIQVFPDILHIDTNMAIAVNMIVILNLTGFLEKNNIILKRTINSIIFLSLIKISILDIEDLGKIDYFFSYLFFLFSIFFFNLPPQDSSPTLV